MHAWTSGEQCFTIALTDAKGEPEAPGIDVRMVVQLIPLGLLILGMGYAETDDPRIPEPRRKFGITWPQPPPSKTSMEIDPLADLGSRAMGTFASMSTNEFGSAVRQSLAAKPAT